MSTSRIGAAKLVSSSTDVAETLFQTVDGWGYSSKPFDNSDMFSSSTVTMTASEQNAVLEFLNVQMKLNRNRPFVRGVFYPVEETNDNSDPLVTNEAGFSFERINTHVTNLNTSIAQGVNMRWISPVNRESWMGTSTANDAAEYAEWLLAMVRRYSTNGQPLTHLSIANEPSYTGNTLSGAFIRDVIKNLCPRMAAEDLLVPIIIPDDVRASDALAKSQIIMADSTAAQYVGAIATHLYDESISNLTTLGALASQYDLPLWMTEFSRPAMSSAGLATTDIAWPELMHDLLVTYNVSAIDYLWGWFGSEDGAQLVVLNHSGNTYTGSVPRKVAYYMGQYSRHIPQGSVRVGVTTSDSSVKVSAYSTGAKRVVVALNTTGGSLTPTFTLATLGGASSVSGERTSASENWVAVGSISVSGNTFSPTLPAGSVTTFETP